MKIGISYLSTGKAKQNIKLELAHWDFEKAGSRTMEYAYNDYCIALVAKVLEKDSIARKYSQCSSNGKTFVMHRQKEGSAGFIWPRKKEGSWDPNWNVHQSEGWRVWLYEGNSWEYSLYVPHNVEKVIEKSGGKKAFNKKLDTFFTKNSQTFHSWLNDYYNVNNEPGFLSPTLYNYIGKPYKTSETVRKIISNNYTRSRMDYPAMMMQAACRHGMFFMHWAFFL